VDGVPIWLLTFRVLVPGTYRIKVVVRFFNDFNQRRYIFFGESEARPGSHDRTHAGGFDCNVESSILEEDIYAIDESNSQNDDSLHELANR